MRTYNVEYAFKGEPRSHEFQLDQGDLPIHEAAMHLIVLHFGDGENSLVMPAADATPEEILEQAELLEISHVRVHGMGG